MTATEREAQSDRGGGAQTSRADAPAVAAGRGLRSLLPDEFTRRTRNRPSRIGAMSFEKSGLRKSISRKSVLRESARE